MVDFAIPVMIEVDAIVRLCTIAPAALLDVLFRRWPGFWRSKFHPGSVLGRFLGRVDSKLNRRYRSETSRFARGVLVLAFRIVGCCRGWVGDDRSGCWFAVWLAGDAVSVVSYLVGCGCACPDCRGNQDRYVGVRSDG